MEFAQHAEYGALVDHTPALSPAAGVAGPLSPGADVGNGSACDGVLLVCQLAVIIVVVVVVDVVLVVVVVVLLAGAGSCDGHGSRARHGGLYSHGSRHGEPGRVR